MLKNTVSSYGTVNKFLHWSIALLVINVLGVVLYMTDLPKGETKSFLFNMHKTAGITVLLLVIARIVWRFVNITPDLPTHMPPWQKKAAKGVHYILYSFLILYPLSGISLYVMSGRAVKIFDIEIIPALTSGKTLVSGYAGFIHFNMPFVVIGFISLHTLVALYHHFVIKDNVLRRML